MKQTKLIFDPQFVLLTLLVVFVLGAMILFGPRNSLDTRFYYTGSEAHAFLQSLSPQESFRYLVNEVIDVAFILLYTAWLFKIFYFLKVRQLWLYTLIFTPGFFDLIETNLILYSLQNEGPHLFLNWLGFITLLKWISFIYVLCTAFFFKLKNNKMSS